MIPIGTYNLEETKPKTNEKIRITCFGIINNELLIR